MTPQTAAQRNQTYRARRKAKLERLARLEGALREIAGMDVVDAMCDPGWAIRTARQALGDVA